jgi:hypothetical protein
VYKGRGFLVNYTYGNLTKWRNKGILSILNLCIVTIAWIIMFASNNLSKVFFLIISAILLFYGCFRIYRAVYFFQLPRKDYLIMNEQILIIKGQFMPKKEVSFAQMKQVTKVNETIVIKLENGEEELIYLDWLDKEDSFQLWEQLKGKVGTVIQSS